MRTYLIFGAAILLTAINGLMLTRHFVQYLDRRLVGDIHSEIAEGLECAYVTEAYDQLGQVESDRDWIISVLANAYMIGANQAGGTVQFEITEYCRQNPFKPFIEALKQCHFCNH